MIRLRHAIVQLAAYAGWLTFVDGPLLDRYLNSPESTATSFRQRSKTMIYLSKAAWISGIVLVSLCGLYAINSGIGQVISAAHATTEVSMGMGFLVCLYVIWHFAKERYDHGEERQYFRGNKDGSSRPPPRPKKKNEKPYRKSRRKSR